MPASSLPTLVYLPFLAILALAGTWVVLRRLRRSAVKRGARRARQLVEQGKFDEMERYLQGRGQVELAASLLTEHGRTERAVELLVDAGRYLQAAQTASAAELHQRAGELFQRAGDFSSAGACYLASGDYDDAVRLMRQAGELAPAARFLEQRDRPVLALPIYLELKDYGRAAVLAREHLTDRRQLKEVADQLVAVGRHEAAVPLFMKANYLLEAGRALEQVERYDLAVQAYLKQNYFREAARVYAHTGEHLKAAELFLKAGQIEQAGDSLVRAQAFLAVARLYRRADRPARAVDAVALIPFDHPDYRAAQLLATSIEEENHRFEDAAARLQAFLDSTGYQAEDLELVYRVVDLQIQVGNKEGAIECLERAKRAGITEPHVDEQLMGLREAPEGLFDPSPEDESTVPAHRRARFRGDTTTIGFPRSDRYVLKRKLARGGHGILFLVEDRKLHRDVVLKLLHSESLPSDLARKYFFREARTAASLDHDNIVHVFDYGEIEGRPYLSMEHVDGLNLLELQESLQNEVPFDRSVSICAQLCDALQYAHNQSIIHRDIKMENVMVTTRWQTKLMDFGLAKALNENPDRSLFIIGTPFYMSPEQIVGDALDPRTDIYSVGILMYRLFTGRLPFEDGEVLSHHRFTPPPDPREFRPDLPRLLADTIMVCIKKDPDERFDSAELVAKRLAELRSGAGLSQTRQG